MIGKHECKCARDTDLKGAITIGLDEAFTALEESIHDLDDEQVRAFAIPDRNNIAWIMMHTLHNLDMYANAFQAGDAALSHNERWSLWKCRYNERPKPGDDFPSQDELMKALDAVRTAATAGIGSASESDLNGRRAADDWWPASSADAYMRTIFHAMAHARQVWLLRGALGLLDGKSWPQQHWA